jgi:hypothetical protein
VADAIETQIVLAARDALLGISPGDGYHTRPRVQIGPGVQPPTPLTEPTLLVHDAEGSQAFRIIHYPPMWEHRIKFAVECWAHGTGEDGRTAALLNLIADVRRCLLRRHRTLEGIVETIDEAEPDNTDESMLRPVGTSRLDFVARVTTSEED